MRLNISTTGVLSTALIGLAAATSPLAHAQEVQDDTMVLDIRYAGLAGVEPHDKDSDAHRALMMLGERLAEIPGETDGPKEARDGIEMLWELLRGATSLRIDQSNEAPGVSIAISNSPAAPMTGDAFLGRIVEFVENTGGPIDQDEQGHFVQSPVGPVRVDAADGSMVSIRLGTETAAATEVMSYGLPANTDPIMSGQIDLQKLGQFVARFLAEEDPGFAELLEEYPWAIEEAPLVEFAYGKDDQYQIITSRMYDSEEWLSKLGTDSSVTFERDNMAVIPQDATLAVGFPFSLDFMLGMIDRAAEETGEDPFAMIEEELGFDVRGDVLENIGPHFMYYQADSTGGGGFLSSVLICEVRNAPDLKRAHTNLRNRFNEFAGEQAKGYIRVRTWNSGGHDVYSLVTPGLPVPFEPSWAVLGENLVVAGSPLGLSAAISQLDQGETSVLDNPKFAEAVLEIMPGDEVASFAFGDTERLATRGYGGLNYLLSGLSNAVRSPSDPAREAGILTPSYSSFVEGIKPRGTVSYWDGDDYLTMSRLDGSVLVETAEAFGFIGSSQGAIAGGAMGLGVMLPALGKARESAQQLKSATQVRAITQGILIYASENDDRAPESVEQLIEAGYLTHELLDSPFGPAYDGMGDIVMRTDLDAELVLSYRNDLVVAMDRAMYVNGSDVVNIGFADNHVATVPYWQADEILDLEVNAGAREFFNLD